MNKSSFQLIYFPNLFNFFNILKKLNRICDFKFKTKLLGRDLDNLPELQDEDITFFFGY